MCTPLKFQHYVKSVCGFPGAKCNPPHHSQVGLHCIDRGKKYNNNISATLSMISRTKWFRMINTPLRTYYVCVRTRIICARPSSEKGYWNSFFSTPGECVRARVYVCVWCVWKCTVNRNGRVSIIVSPRARLCYIIMIITRIMYTANVRVWGLKHGKPRSLSEYCLVL